MNTRGKMCVKTQAPLVLSNPKTGETVEVLRSFWDLKGTPIFTKSQIDAIINKT